VTFLALTVTPDRSKIVVSQDQGLAPTRARDTMPHGEAYTAPGRGAAPVPPAQLVGKVMRTGGVVLAGLGAYGALAGMAELLRDHAVDDLDAALDLNLRGHLDAFNVPPSIVFLAGRSERLGRLAAFMLSAPLYEPVELACGHTLHPPPCEDLDSYDHIHDLWTPAAHGEGTEAFHVAEATNVRTAWLERRLREPVTFGGDLQVLTLTAEGVVEREAPGFWS